MKRKALVDPVKCVLMFGCFLIFLVCGIALISVGSRLFGVLAIAVSLVYIAGAAHNSAVIRITPEYISRQLLWFQPTNYRWEEIGEIGVFGTKLFGDKNKHTGTLYIYISAETMTDDERFQMIFHWPPKKLYFAYNKALLDACRCFWPGKVVSYNASKEV